MSFVLSDRASKTRQPSIRLRNRYANRNATIVIMLRELVSKSRAPRPTYRCPWSRAVAWFSVGAAFFRNAGPVRFLSAILHQSGKTAAETVKLHPSSHADGG
jgi:hypothetical protein